MNLQFEGDIFLLLKLENQGWADTEWTCLTDRPAVQVFTLKSKHVVIIFFKWLQWAAEQIIILYDSKVYKRERGRIFSYEYKKFLSVVQVS